jgi:hypothetical protein
MASREYLVANLSRAVVQTVRQCEGPAFAIDRDDVGSLVDAWSFTLAGHGLVHSQESNDARIFPRGLARRLILVFREAASTEQIAQISASLEGWIQVHSASAHASKSILDYAQLLVSHGQTDTALDLIFDRFDEMLLAGDFNKLDQILAQSCPENLSVDLLVGVLTVTLPARNRLDNRKGFFERVKLALQNRGELQDDLLIGLE